MGLLVGIIQRRQLRMEKSNLAFQLLLITKAMSVAANSANELMQVGTDYESDSLIAKKLQERQYKLKLLEEKLSLQKEEIQTRLNEVEEELKSVESMINSEIKTMFSYNVPG